MTAGLSEGSRKAGGHRPPLQNTRGLSDFAKLDAGYSVIGRFFENQVSPLARWEDVFAKVAAVDVVPDLKRSRSGLFIGELGISVEVGLRVHEDGLAKAEEPVNVPLSDVLFLRVYV